MSIFALEKKKDNNTLKGKKIMIALMTFAVVAIMIAQAVNVESKLA